jgi:chaperonin GroES
MNIKPLYDRVVIKKIEDAERKTAGGIVLPDSVQDKKGLRGEIVAVGEGKLLDNGTVRPLAIKVGDKVAYAEYSGRAIRFDDVEYQIVKEEDILAVLG